MSHYNFRVYQRAETNKQNDSITQIFNGLKLSADQIEERTNTVYEDDCCGPPRSQITLQPCTYTADDTRRH